MEDETNVDQKEFISKDHMIVMAMAMDSNKDKILVECKLTKGDEAPPTIKQNDDIS